MKTVRILSALLAVMLLLSACAKKPTASEIKGTATQTEEQTTGTLQETPPAPEKPQENTQPVEQPETKPQPSPEQAPAQQEKTPQTDKEEPKTEPEPQPEQTPEIGKISGAVYENSFFGFGCQLSENWIFASQEELSQMNGWAADAIGDEAISELVRNSNTFYDMCANSADGLMQINVGVENLGALYGLILTEEEYVDMSIENVQQALLSMGFTDVKAEKNTLSFAGAEHFGLHLVSTTEGVQLYQQLVCVKNGDYMACVTVTSGLADATEEMMGAFYPVSA